MTQAMHKTMWMAACLAAAMALSGCGADLGELRAKIEQAKQRPGGRIEPLPEVVPYESYDYSMANERSPFLQSLAGEQAEGPRPDVKRAREYLEQFPLDTLKMVGTLQRDNKRYALLQTQDGLVHRVQAGNYVGQNDGRVISVSEGEVKVDELVPDGIGGFYKRSAAIGLAD